MRTAPSTHFFLPICLLIFLCYGCADKPSADTILLSSQIYTVDSLRPWAEAIAFDEDKILAVGSKDEVFQFKGPMTKVLDVGDHFVMPGLIEGHGHFHALGESLIDLNFLHSKSWEEIVQMVEGAARNAQPDTWIVGRGWHQEKWDSTPVHSVQGYPTHHALSQVTPENPVLLRHASGHALIANEKAMRLAGITAETPDPDGGVVLKDTDGSPSGVFEERAEDLIDHAHEAYLANRTKEEAYAEWLAAVELAEAECIKHGITSFQDAGTNVHDIGYYKTYAKDGKLDVRLWIMVRDNIERLESALDSCKVTDDPSGFLTINAVKGYLDGALGAYGAWLLRPYNDRPGWHGQPTASMSEIEAMARLSSELDMQYCVHAIGDRANREVLNLFESFIQNGNLANDHRWRIEHAQHVGPQDIPRFGQLGVIASMQAVHCTSDAPFVEKRLGTQRAKESAYVWRSLLDSGARLANGTDCTGRIGQSFSFDLRIYHTDDGGWGHRLFS